MTASSPAIVALDIDGTFLDPTGHILPGTRSELARAREAGATIVLASGRPIPGLRGVLQTVQLPSDGVVLAGSNGSVVVDAHTGDLIARHSFDADLARRLLDFCTGHHEVVTMLFAADAMIVDRPDEPQVVIEAQSNSLTFTSMDNLRELSLVEVALDKVLLYGPPEVLRPVAAEFQAEFGDDVESAFSAPFYFEATAAGVDKGSALADVAAARGVDVLDSVAFGDNGNDLPLLRRAGIGVAMGNAIAEVREAADRVTGSNADEGIAHVLADLYGGGVPAPPVPEPETVPVYPDGFDVVLNDEPDADLGSAASASAC